MPSAGELIRASDIGGDVGCRLRRAATQSFTSGADAAISWDTEDQDTDGFIAVTATTVTIPTGLGGLYAVVARVLWASIAGNTRAYLDIVPVINSGLVGVPDIFRVGYPGVSETRHHNTVVVPLGATDTFTVHAFQTTGAPVTLTAWLACYRIASF